MAKQSIGWTKLAQFCAGLGVDATFHLDKYRREACSRCGKMLSKDTRTCPRCGEPKRKGEGKK